MKKLAVGVDASPLYSEHRIRGIGFYTRNLLESLKEVGDSRIEIGELRSEKEVERGEFDLLHRPFFSPFFPFLFQRKDIPLAVTVHDIIPLKYPKHYPPGLRGRARWWRQKRYLKKAAAVITDSHASKKDITKLAGYPRNQIHVVYLAAGKEFELIKNRRRLEKVRDKYRLPDKFVLYVGDVNWNKNVPGLVKACKRAKAPLVIVGKQAASKNFDLCHLENRDLVWLKEEIDGKQLTALGFVETEDLVVIYNLATVYCQPSFDEGFGLPVLEAMACGCPVVSSNKGSLPEVVRDTGALVDPDVDSLSAAISRLLSSPSLRKKFSQAGLKRAGRFSWRKTAKEVFAVYRAVLQLS